MAQNTFKKKHESKYLRGLFVFWSKNPGCFSSVWRGQSFSPSSQQVALGHSSQRRPFLGRMVFVHFQALITFALGPQLSPFLEHCFDFTYLSWTNTVPWYLHGFFTFPFMPSVTSCLCPCWQHTNRLLSQWCSKNAFRELSLLASYFIFFMWTTAARTAEAEAEERGRGI